MLKSSNENMSKSEVGEEMLKSSNTDEHYILSSNRSKSHMRLVTLRKLLPSTFIQIASRDSRIMAESGSNTHGKKRVTIDVTSDNVCPWCFVGKRNLDKAIATSKDRFDFEIKWHPFLLDPSAPKEGVNKLQFYREKFGSQTDGMVARMTEVFKSLDLEYNISGLTGDTLDSHRLIYFAGQKGLDKQHKLVEDLFIGYFTQAKYIGDREFLQECAAKVGIDGAAEFLADPNNGVNEVKEDLEKYSANIRSVPYYVINGKHKLSGGQPPEVFLRAFEAAAS